MVEYGYNYDPPYRESHTGRKIFVFAAVVTLAAGLWTRVLSDDTKERLTTHHDECGDRALFYEAPEGVVNSCAPLVDKTTQEAERKLFQFVPQPDSLKILPNGNYAVGAEITYEGDAAERVFGEAVLTLDEYDDLMQENEVTRAYCVSDMERVARYIQENTDLYAKGTVSNYELGDAENAYNVGPAGLNPNDPEKPDLFIYDASLNQPTKNVLITCWTP